MKRRFTLLAMLSLFCMMAFAGSTGSVLKVTGMSKKANVWDQQIQYTLPQNLEANQTYTLKMNIKLDAAWNGSFWPVGAAGTQYDGVGRVEAGEQTVVKTFTYPQAISQLAFVFGDYEGASVEISSISLMKEGSYDNLVANGDFAADNINGWNVVGCSMEQTLVNTLPELPWEEVMNKTSFTEVETNYWNDGGIKASLDGSSLVLTSAEVASWRHQVIVLDNLTLEAGAYRMTINCSADQAVDIYGNLGSWSSSAPFDAIKCTTSAKDHVVEIKGVPEGGGQHLVLQFTPACSVKINSIKLERQSSKGFVTVWEPLFSSDLANGVNRNFIGKFPGTPYDQYPTLDVVDGVVSVDAKGAEATSDDLYRFLMIGDANLYAGDKVRIKFDYKASEDATTNSNWLEGKWGYKYWTSVGELNFTTDWKTYDVQSVLSGFAGAATTVALNLTKTRKDVVYSFKDLSLEVERLRLGMVATAGEYNPFITIAPTYIPENVDAFYVRKNDIYNGDDNYIEFTSLSGLAVPAGSVIFIKGDGVQALQVATGTPEELYNALYVADGSYTPTANDYVLGTGEEGFAFYPAEALPKGTIYLHAEGKEAVECYLLGKPAPVPPAPGHEVMPAVLKNRKDVAVAKDPKKKIGFAIYTSTIDGTVHISAVEGYENLEKGISIATDDFVENGGEKTVASTTDETGFSFEAVEGTTYYINVAAPITLHVDVVTPYDDIDSLMVTIEERMAELDELYPAELRSALGLAESWARIKDLIAAEYNKLALDKENHPEPSSALLAVHMTRILVIKSAIAAFENAALISQSEKLYSMIDQAMEKIDETCQDIEDKYGINLTRLSKTLQGIWNALKKDIEREKDSITNDKKNSPIPPKELLDQHEDAINSLAERLEAFASELGIPTAIENANVNTAEKANTTFNLAGQKVNAETKGLVIKNGRTVIVK